MKLQDTAFFRGLTVKETVSLACCFVERTAAPEETVFHEGDQADALVILLDGVFELTREGSQGPVHLAYADPGTLLGQVALIDSGLRTASLRALDRSRYAVLDRGTFDKLRFSDGATAATIQLKLARVATAELRNANRQLLELLAVPLTTSTSPETQRVLGLVDSLWKASIYR